MRRDAIERKEIVEAAIATFQGPVFRPGKYDCVRLAAFVLRKRGHKPRLGRGGSYSSMLGAKRALARAGFASLEAALDSLKLPRIPPAAALPGDIILVPGEGDLDALHVAVSNGRTLAYHADLPSADILQPTAFIAAWRV